MSLCEIGGEKQNKSAFQCNRNLVKVLSIRDGESSLGARVPVIFCSKMFICALHGDQCALDFEVN